MARKPATPSNGKPSKSLVSNSDGALSSDEYRRRVAEAAYYRALARGFEGGDPVTDWLEAEQEVARAAGR